VPAAYLEKEDGTPDELADQPVEPGEEKILLL